LNKIYFVMTGFALSIAVSLSASAKGDFEDAKWVSERCNQALKVARVIEPDLVARHDPDSQKLKNAITQVFVYTELSIFEVGRGISEYVSYYHNGVTEIYKNGYYQRVPYEESLGKSFLKLGPNSHIMDLGAGMLAPAMEINSKDLVHNAEAIVEEYPSYSDFLLAAEKFQKDGAPNTTAITMVDFAQEKFFWKPVNKHTVEEIFKNPKLEPLFGRYFELIPNSELIAKFGMVNLFLDLSGVLAYTLNLPLVLEKIAAISNEGAEIWMRDNLVKIRLKDGTIISQAEYIGRVKGFKRMTDPNVKAGAFLYERTGEAFVKPNLELIDLKPSNPNITLYQEH
jgi:hypothetical protein